MYRFVYAMNGKRLNVSENENIEKEKKALLKIDQP